MAEIEAQVFDQKRYDDARIVDVDTSGLHWVKEDVLEGTIEIEIEGGERKTITGEHGTKDYCEEYGFMLS